jgi:hypothetical protein
MTRMFVSSAAAWQQALIILSADAYQYKKPEAVKVTI